MVDSRLRLKPDSTYLCFLEIAQPERNEGPKITKSYPKVFKDKEEILKRAPEFSFPCPLDNQGVQYSTFVLTDIDSKFRYGFCRYLPRSSHCLCILSYLPWFETFYSVLDKISEFKDDNTLLKFLQLLLDQRVPKPASKLKFTFISAKTEMLLTFDIPDTRKLPSIPSNRNLTEYYAKVDPENMVNLFISMLFERRIIVTSSKLSLLTAVVHGSVSLLYPMQWQHIFVPVLPPSLLPYCCAPMPFLVGIHTSMMKEVRQMPLDEVVIYDADTKKIEINGDDFKNFPSQVSTRLKRKLQRMDRAFQNDYVSRLFLKALADLIGGYRDALKYTETKEGSRVVFDEEMFLETRSGELKNFLTDILALQSFQQFIGGRLDLLNEGIGFADIFEQAVSERNADSASEAKYKQWMDKMRYEVKKGGGAFKKTVGEKYTDLKAIEVKKNYNKIKKKMKDGYKEVKNKASALNKQSNAEEFVTDTNIKRNHSMPATTKHKLLKDVHKDRRSMYSSLPRRDVPKPTKTPPPRPPPPSRPYSVAISNAVKSTEFPRKNLVNPLYKESSSERNLAGLISPQNISSPTMSSDLSSADSECSLDSARYLYNSNTSSESVGYTNPVFRDPHDSLLIADEEDVLESTPVSPSDHKDLIISSENEKTETQRVKNHISLKRGVPFVNRKNRSNRTLSGAPKSYIYPNSDTVTESNINASNENLVVDYSSEFNSIYNEEPILEMPSSPFYTPNSEDLKGLDLSLFQETMSALSDDTRNLVVKGSPPSDNSSFESISETSISGSFLHLDNINDSSCQKQSQKLEHETKVIHMDPFATFYEEAKKEFTASNIQK